MARLTHVHLEAKRFVLAVWPEEERGQKKLQRRGTEYFFWMQGIYFLRNIQPPILKMK